MSYEKIKQAKKVVVGMKQTIKALNSGTSTEVIVAADADSQILTKVKELAAEKGVPLTEVGSMKELGKAAGIDVGAATVAIIE
ncbi:MAG: 50S ribosomal protein L7ae-like protein [Caldibacillus debilis]|uniref:50S ribosomal protein L7ae-like protein n=1 Tax=Caldibacillus debilis TaxID=301148 RepID=A0A3E0K907_9BACI|nr:50S ribosomal protein L7ae-like protein [Caldibacillus debilis]REJ31487.1 MAG: 50S ribosomal protein L7ae-like protein [Caldibacillus debilis]